MRIFAALMISALLFANYARAEDETMTFMQKFNEELTKYRAKTKITTKAAGTLASVGYCVVQQVGMKETWALYEVIRDVEATAHTMCHSKQEEAAKSYVLSEYTRRQNDPAVKAALSCFESRQTAVAGILNPRKGALIPDYIRWAHNPALARTEMSAQTLCH